MLFILKEMGLCEKIMNPTPVTLVLMVLLAFILLLNGSLLVNFYNQAGTTNTVGHNIVGILSITGGVGIASCLIGAVAYRIHKKNPRASKNP